MRDDLITVKIHKDILLNMLIDRLDYWSNSINYEEKDLLIDMYERYIDDGIFEYCEFNLHDIVDNDVVNWCSVIKKDSISEEDWERLEKFYENGKRDVSCEYFDSLGISFIESMNDNMILVRH